MYILYYYQVILTVYQLIPWNKKLINVHVFPFSVFLGNIKQAFDKNPNLSNLLLDDFFKKEVQKCQVKNDLLTPLVGFDLQIYMYMIYLYSE